MGYRGYEHNHVEPHVSVRIWTLLHDLLIRKSQERAGSGRTLSPSRFDVKNTGKRAGATVAQLYVSQVSPTVERPAKELKGFERVQLQPGETKHVTAKLDPEASATST